jgi:ATP/maltotriose-dependent transcriptional regulator MalT
MASTNRQIGERLYMSEKTASVHVSRILRKLGASNRAEAAASAERLGLVGQLLTTARPGAPIRATASDP